MATVMQRIKDWTKKIGGNISEKMTPTSELTYLISDDRRSIKCLRCGRTSYNKKDIQNLFCGLCGYHELPKA